MLYRNQTDETLVMLTLAGDQNAYEALVVRHQKAVIAAADSVIRSRFMAEDAAQDAFVTAWMKLNTLMDASKYGAWVCRIAKNCALNMARRFRNFMPLEMVENIDIQGDRNYNPAELYAESEEKEELHKTIGKLPEKVKQIIHLHYFEGLSISEIADRMRISEGTVKWQLHDGRKRLRKELCAMNEKYNDTLVQRVMKKVEELKLWQYKNSKNGFATVYNDVLKEVEELPECKDKYHALADVLMRGWWWLPGKKNDALFERIRESAEIGKNDEVMQFIVAREDEKLYGDDKIAFIRDKQIPRLEKSGFKYTLAYEWFWLGRHYFDNNQSEKGFEATEKVFDILKPSDLYYIYAKAAIENHKLYQENYKGKNQRRYILYAGTDEFRMINGSPCRFFSESVMEGALYSCDREIDWIFRHASGCDGRFMINELPVGERYIGSDGTELVFVSDTETVETPCGTFENCALWQTVHNNYSKYSTWYADGVGIVKLERSNGGIKETRILNSYEIKDGSGYLPFCNGNRWEYSASYNPDIMEHFCEYTVAWSDNEKTILSHKWRIERFAYDENSWEDMIRQVRGEYWNYNEQGNETIQDVSYPISRALELAKTPIQIAHSKAACAVAKRILETDIIFNPNTEITGHWNFFNRNFAVRKNGTITSHHDDFQWNFEWKRTVWNDTAMPAIYFNDIYDILQDATNCIWSDEWQAGKSQIVEYLLWSSKPIKTQISCSDGETVTTKAGTFNNCLKLCLNTEGQEEGWYYRGGKKTYYFAEGIGIVRTENLYAEGAKTAVYELSSYEGVGSGYMPIEDGMVRFYEGVSGFTDGYYASAEYIYVDDGDGNIVIFANRTGIRKKLPPITQYSAIENEVKEEALWNEGKYDESRYCHAINNVYLICHFLFRPSRYWAAPEKAVAWNKQRLRFVQSLSPDGNIPPAWKGFYASTAFRTGCALCGMGKNDEGYEYLEKAFDAVGDWFEYPDGEALDMGDPLVFGNIKLLKKKYQLQLPDGGIETEPNLFNFDLEKQWFHGWLTAPHGWEWFDGVRNEDRYKELIKRAEKLMD